MNVYELFDVGEFVIDGDVVFGFLFWFGSGVVKCFWVRVCRSRGDGWREEFVKVLEEVEVVVEINVYWCVWWVRVGVFVFVLERIRWLVVDYVVWVDEWEEDNFCVEYRFYLGVGVCFFVVG